METLGIKTHRAGAAAVSLLAVLVLLTGCQRNGAEPASAHEAKMRLDISLSVDGGASVSNTGTKSIVTGTTLNQEGRTYGIIACEHEDTPEKYLTYDHDNANLYGNIQAWYGNYNSNGTGWWFSYESTSNYRFNPLYFVTDNTTRRMDIYAYAPWKSGVTIADGYKYDLSLMAENDINDVMYATYEDGTSNPTTNTGITIVDGGTTAMNINFHHALARIAFHFKLANSQNTGLDGYHAVRLYQIRLLKSETSATPLYIQGSMNLLSGAVTPIGQSRTEQSVNYSAEQNRTDAISTYDIYQSDVWKSFNMLVHPTPYQQDGDFALKFYFNGLNESQAFICNYEIRKDDLKHSDGVTFGFQPGYCYHFYFIIDNYIHLQNVVVNTDWTLTDETEIKV